MPGTGAARKPRSRTDNSIYTVPDRRLDGATERPRTRFGKSYGTAPGGRSPSSRSKLVIVDATTGPKADSVGADVLRVVSGGVFGRGCR